MSLAQVYRRLAEVCPDLDLTLGAPGPADGPGWVDGARLAHDPAALRGWLEGEAARIQDGCGRQVRPDVVASRALHGYLWSACLLISGPWFLAGRVPRLRLEDVWLGPDAALRVAVPDSYACLPGDPEAGEAEAGWAEAGEAAGGGAAAQVLAGAEALRADLRRAVADHAGPLLAALRPYTRRGERALWGMVGDDLISGLWHLGTALGDEAHGAAMATLLLPGPKPPFPAGADFRPLPGGEQDGRRLTRTRAGCCLYYTIDPQDVCGTCPRLLAAAPAGPLPDHPALAVVPCA